MKGIVAFLFGGLLFLSGGGLSFLGLAPTLALAEGAATRQGLLAAATTGADGIALMARNPLQDRAMGTRPKGGVTGTGAMGVNRDYEAGKRPEPLIEDQRGGVDWIQSGLVRNLPEWRDRGWRALQWGFNIQSPDGSFVGGREPIHSTVLFIEAAGRAALLEWKLGDASLALSFRDDIARTAHWLARQQPARTPEMQANARYTHRLWAMAAALKYAAELSGRNQELERRAADFAGQALQAQWEDGIFPERGGFDVGYHATSIVFAARYAATCRDPARRAVIVAALSKAADWLAGRVQVDGSVDPAGSTRILQERDRYGRMKNVPYGLVAEAFADSAWLTGREDLHSTANRVMASSAFTRYFSPPTLARQP
jgi:hypothetical protein